MRWLAANWRVWALRLLLVAVIFGGWAYETRPGRASAVVLPAIPEVARTLGTTLAGGGTWSAIGVTLIEVLVGLGIAVVAGSLVGFLGSRTQWRADVVQPLAGWAYMVPMVLFFPLFELWFGVGMWSKIAYAAANAFLPVAFNTITGFRSVQARYLRVAHAYGASATQTELLVKLPASLPFVLAGVRTAAALAFISVILGETLAATRGIGSQLTLASQTLDATSEFAYIIIILLTVGLVQVGIDRSLGRGERRLRGQGGSPQTHR